jgi:hypothetical protein
MAVDLHVSYESLFSFPFKSNEKFNINALCSYTQYACVLSYAGYVNFESI